MEKVPTVLETLTAVAQIKSAVKERWDVMKPIERRRLWLELRQMRSDINGR